jgi:uncharacterized membrane protein
VLWQLVRGALPSSEDGTNVVRFRKSDEPSDAPKSRLVRVLKWRIANRDLVIRDVNGCWLAFSSGLAKVRQQVNET